MKVLAADPRILCDDEIHVWLAHLVEDEDVTAKHVSILNCDEAARAADFSYERLRMHFVQTHAIARRILAGYAGVDPTDLVSRAGCSRIGLWAGLRCGARHCPSVSENAAALLERKLRRLAFAHTRFSTVAGERSTGRNCGMKPPT
jgi:hypothetical protein